MGGGETPCVLEMRGSLRSLVRGNYLIHRATTHLCPLGGRLWPVHVKVNLYMKIGACHGKMLPFLALFGISFSNLKKLRLHMTINVLKYVEEYLDVPLSVFR